MFDTFKKKPVTQQFEIRDTLFGDIPMARWTNVSPEALASEPWSSFAEAERQISSGDEVGAARTLQEILKTPQLESRVYLQAWHFLRKIGSFPSKETAKELLGVVVEVGMEKGLDIVAAYPDHHARYYNFSGAGVVWERPDDRLDDVMDQLLEAGKSVVQAIGPWQGDRPAAPTRGQARINLLTPSGLHFGQGPLEQLSRDRLGGPVLASAFQLMQALIKLAKK